MTTPLNYQPRNSAVYYTPPSRVDLWRTIGGFLAVAIACIDQDDWHAVGFQED